MTRLLLDTTFLIDTEGTGGDLDAAIDDDDDVAIAAITVAELRVGVLLARGGRRADRESFFAEVAETIPIVDYDSGVAEAHAALLVQVRGQGTPRGAHDLMTAATAKHTRRTILSADASAFENLDGVQTKTHR
ncbi:MAG: PIN domain-containing protein [Acidimicrobiales bacterium]